jgi:hypothetical protein
MKNREKVNAFTQIRENNEVSWSFLHETSLNCHLTQNFALISENTSLNAFLFLHGQFHAIPEFRFDTISINARNWKEFLGIPTDSEITTYMDLITNDRSWLSIEFRYGIPGIGSSS